MKIRKEMLITSIILSSLTASYAMALSDSEIAEVLRVANQAEIDAAKVATSKTTNSDIKGFAKHMISGHQENEKKELQVIKKASITETASDSSKELKRNAQNQLSDLKAKNGTDFDKAYIDNQVTMHDQLLKDLNDKFIPAASNPEFKKYLEATKEDVKKHLSKAQEIQNSMAK